MREMVFHRVAKPITRNAASAENRGRRPMKPACSRLETIPQGHCELNSVKNHRLPIGIIVVER